MTTGGNVLMVLEAYLEQTKACIKCGAEKPLSAFYADSRREDGHRARCKPCDKPGRDVSLRNEFKLPADVDLTLHVQFPWQSLRAKDILEFARRNPGTTARWMHVPANGDWWSLDVYAEVNGLQIHLDPRGGWTTKEAQALEDEIKVAEHGWPTRTPAPFAYRP